LAGAYSLHSGGLITYEAAVKWVSDKDWTEIKNTESDELTLLSKLMETITTVEGGGSKFERTIGELILRAAGPFHIDGEIVRKDDADARLKRLGFKVVEGGFLVANNSNYIDGLLKETNWSKNHQKILIRIPGSEQVDSTRFAPTVRSRAVFIPLRYLE
jgi:hypothetical protein